MDDTAKITRLKRKMGDEFEIKNLRNLKYFLGMEVVRSREVISVSQTKYAFGLLQEMGRTKDHPTDNPVKFTIKLGNFVDKVLTDKEKY